MAAHEQKEREVKEQTSSNESQSPTPKHRPSIPATSPLPGGPSSTPGSSSISPLLARNILKAHLIYQDDPLFESPYSASLCEAVDFMHTAEVKDRQAFSALLDQPEHAKPLASGFVTLHRANILTEENRQHLLAHPQYADHLAQGLIFLHEAGILEEYRQHLLADPQYADRIGQGLAGLHSAKASTPQNQIGVLAQPRYAHRVSRGLVSLHKVDAKALPLKDRLALGSALCLPENAPSADKLGQAWAVLAKAKLMSPSNRDTVQKLATSEYAESFVKTLSGLLDWGALNQLILIELVKQAPYLENLLPILEGLHEEGWLNQKTLAGFLAQAPKARELVDKLSDMAKKSKLSLENVVALVEQAAQTAPAFSNVGAILQLSSMYGDASTSPSSQNQAVATSSSSSTNQGQTTDPKDPPFPPARL